MITVFFRPFSVIKRSIFRSLPSLQLGLIKNDNKTVEIVFNYNI
jgi:hypothetical protein